MASEDNHFLETLKYVMVPIHPAGWMFIAMFAGGALVLGLMAKTLGWIGFILTLWCIYFFRDPKRIVPEREGLIVSPADGLVQKIARVIPPAELDLGTTERTRISIFLSVFDVHVNRVPVGGKITLLHYVRGKFLNASLDKASEDNERQLVTVKTADGKLVGFVQIAGLVARRIICDLKDGQDVKTGERFGLIRFGSRMDVYLPEGTEPLVIVGQKAIGGETVLADLNGSEKARTGRTE